MADRCRMDTVTRALEELSRRLWDERRVVTYLLFKLTVTKLLLAADERRFVPDALKEVDRTVELLREGESRRDAAVRDLADLWQMHPEELTLEELSRRAPAPFNHTFADHRGAFRELAVEIEAVARENRTLARADLEEVQGTLDNLTGSGTTSVQTYDASGQLGGLRRVGGRVREAL